MSLPERDIHYKGENDGEDTFICGGYISEVVISIPLSLARKSGHFQESGMEDIIVPPRFLNRFSVIARIEGEHGSTWEWVIDEKKILAWWEEEGFPLIWKEERAAH